MTNPKSLEEEFEETIIKKPCLEDEEDRELNELSNQMRNEMGI